jgi:hypothetical protein
LKLEYNENFITNTQVPLKTCINGLVDFLDMFVRNFVISTQHKHVHMNSAKKSENKQSKNIKVCKFFNAMEPTQKCPKMQQHISWK